jgi:Ca2+-binding EF-hand superfamily protein
LIGAEGTALTVTLTQLPSVPKPQVSDLNEIFQRIRDAVYKNGIRTTEFFRDHDKLRSGVITENQFICGLSLCCGRTAHLSRDDIQTVVNHYRNTDGRVRYKEFCDMMENAYNEPDLEKKPTTTVHRPLRGHLSRRLNVLESSEDEKRVQEILARLKVEVSCRRLLLYPYFRDFDRGKGYTRGVTKPQFERLLAFLSLNLTSEEMKLVVCKFENPVGGDVNYPAFIQAIDEEYTGQTKQTETDE